MKKIQLSEHFTYSKLFRFVLPSIIMMVFTSIYGVVDGLFVSNYVGKTPFAAVNLIMPFIMILGAVGFMIGTGGSALTARTLGEGKKELADRYFSMAVLLTIVSGITISVLGLIFLEPIAYWMGATADMIDYCLLYGRILLCSTTMYMLQNVFQSFLVAAEKPKLGLIFTIAAGVTNMVLDALFMAVFNWGLAGAAAATVISESIGGLLPLIYFLRKNNSRLHLVRTKLEWHPVVRMCSNGASEFMSTTAGSLVSILYNSQLMMYAGEDGVAAYGVMMYVYFVFAGMFMGYAVGSAPIVSYHYGASHRDEVKNMLHKSLKIMIITGIAMLVLAQALSGTIASIFVGYDAELCAFTKHAFSIYSWNFVLCGINVYASSFFTALNNGGISAAISFIRTLVFEMACVLILPRFFGIDGIWAALPLAEVLSFFVSAGFLIKNRKRYHYA
ncbi:MAG: MATE family efflux transporter [Solobacterium sp.]|jgi:putative MATE family efflux protein|nr:MATE family efflux transporter [Solobacterium sp.]MCH4222740.1 MATE family efflux transporter [Solobacterium sp.]MCH4266306.1 MATE family efflux transporter [Solobacterium sp.]